MKDFGPIEYLKLIRDKSIAFIKFKYRACAEFAKEAMLDQPLDNDEQLIVKWAFEDPNPVSQEIEKQQMLEELSKRAQEIAETNPGLLKMDQDNEEDFEGAYGEDYGKTYVQQVESYQTSYQNPYQPSEDLNQFSMKELDEFLRKLNLPKYKEKLFANGFNSLEALKELDSISLDAMGICNGEDKKKILDAAAQIQFSQKTTQSFHPYGSYAAVVDYDSP